MAQTGIPSFQSRFLIVLLSAVLYIAAVYLPATLFRVKVYNPGGAISGAPRVDRGLRTLTGGEMLVSSTFGFFYGNFAGAANLLLWLGWVFALRGGIRKAFICSLIAAILSLQTFQLYLHPFLFDEAGVEEGVFVYPVIGYYVWTASILILCIGSWYKKNAPHL